MNPGNLKVVWLCHFSNSEISDHFGTDKIQEVAPWITQMIKLFEDGNEIDLHIVAPNYFTNKDVSFIIGNIHYHFFSYNSFLIPEKHNELYLTVTNCRTIKNKCEQFITGINPDVIHLFGSENLTYSPGVLRLLKRYPVLVSIQGFVSLGKYNTTYWGALCVNKRIEVEKLINSNCNYFASTSIETSNEIRRFNQNAEIFKLHYPTTVPLSISDCNAKKEYDIVFFAPVGKNKGIEDLLDALAMIKARGRALTLLVTGKSSEGYIDYLENKCKILNIHEHVKFAGFLASQVEVHQLAVQARISVLPSYFDNMPGTIRESMYMKLPVVAYDIAGVRPFNKDRECITLAKPQDIEDLADKILYVLDNEEKATLMVENGYKEISSTYDNKLIFQNVINMYHQICK